MQFKTMKELDPSEGIVRLYRDEHHGVSGEKSHVVLIPRPTSDPNDPLSWPAWRRHMVFLSICMFACFNNISGTVLSDSFLTISEVLEISVDTASNLISWVIFAQGVSNFFWVPTAIYIGKRPVFLISCFITAATAVWAAVSTSYESLLAACVVGGFSGGASEALGAAIVNDIYFLHERGSKMGWYIAAISFGSSLGPLFGGYIIEAMGWPWGKWLSAILLWVNFFMIVFFAPETRFYRPSEVSRSSDSESFDERPADPEDKDKFEDKTRRVEEIPVFPQSAVDSMTVTTHKSYRSSLNPWSGIHPNTSYLELMLRPFPLLAYPACAFATLIYSINLASTVMVNVLSSTILIPPPYNFTIGNVGLINIPGLIGQGSGALMGGYCIDKWAAYRARRKDGIFSPESRLEPILIPTVLVSTGIVVFGFAVQQQMHWIAIFVSYGMISVGLTGSVGITMTYVCDSYFPVAAECLELINGIKNLVAFAFIRATVNWVDDQGYERTFGTLAGIYVAFSILAIPLLIWGPRIRNHTSTKWRLISWELE